MTKRTHTIVWSETRYQIPSKGFVKVVRIGKGGPSLGKSFPQKWKWEIEFGGTNCEEWVH
jgi:hypothetical protein